MITSTDCVLRTLGFETSDELLELVHRKTAKLFRHHDGPVRVGVTVVSTEPRTSPAPVFIASARLERAGRDAIVHAEGAGPEEAVRAAMAKLERLVCARVGARRSNARRQPRLSRAAAAST